MKELNELVELAEKADAVANLMDSVNPHTILAIAEAFRALEQRTEAAEAKLAALNPPKVECKCCNGHGCVPEMIDDEEWRVIECPDCLGAGQIKEASSDYLRT